MLSPKTGAQSLPKMEYQEANNPLWKVLLAQLTKEEIDQFRL